MTKDAHNPALCKCEKGGECSCQCPKCWKYRAREAQLQRIAALHARLEKAGIDVEDFAELMLLAVAPNIEGRIAAEVEKAVRAALARMKFDWDDL